ncbi:MAG: hypothetical protein V4505_17130 [Pseudomonadota bacterium]
MAWIWKTGVLLALAAPLAGIAAPAPGHATLRLHVRDAHTVVVRGQGFPEGRLRVHADLDEPHASVACNAEFQRFAVVKNGRFETTIRPGRLSDCDFLCGGEPEHFVVTVEAPGGARLAARKFACVGPRAGRGRP